MTWWDAQPEPVRAVLDLASLRHDATPDVHDRILAAFAPQHADAIREIADQLAWAERLRSEYPTDVLADYYGRQVRVLSPLAAAEQLADAREAAALNAAQMVATLVQGVAAVRAS